MLQQPIWKMENALNPILYAKLSMNQNVLHVMLVMISRMETVLLIQIIKLGIQVHIIKVDMNNQDINNQNMNNQNMNNLNMNKLNMNKLNIQQNLQIIVVIIIEEEDIIDKFR